jgi:Druantia protein DruA
VDRPLVIQGRTVRPEDVVRIREWLQAHPHSNRTRLSRELCLAWNWRNGAGRLKDMAARVLLLKLEAWGHIQLPPRRTASVNPLRNRELGPIAHDQSPIEGPLEKLQPVRMEPVIETTAEAGLFQFLLARYHYWGHRNCLGENLRYLAQDRQGRPLACLLFSSAAWKAAARDQWLGWTSEQRRRRLELLTNNTRFLLLPWVVGVRHLSSHLLGQVTARLSADWQRKYGPPIYLVESFVEQPRFAGACYQAAGWISVGLTTGRTRNDDGLKPRVARKAIYLKALGADALRRLTG